MELPSMRGFKVKPIAIPAEWLKLKPVERVEAMEQWALDNLKPRQAVSGAYLIEKDPRSSQEPIAGNCWILRHNDYDTGRGNVEIQMREVLRGKTFVWHARHDELSEGYLTDYVERVQYLRGQADDRLVWERHYSVVQKHEDPIARRPALRVAELWRQCWFIDLQLTHWLHSNVGLLHSQTMHDSNALRPFQMNALYSLMGTSLLWLAMSPIQHEIMLEQVRTGPADTFKTFDAVNEFRLGKQDELRRRNRLAGPEHYALYDRLKRSLDYLQKHRKEPMERRISQAALLRLQRRWVNICRRHVQAFA